MNFELIDVKDKSRWRYYLDKIKRNDIYYTPEYFEIYQENGEGKAKLFVYKEEENIVYYPFLIREINSLPFFRTNSLLGDNKVFDITTPYGYGGPITNIDDSYERNQLIGNFNLSFKKFCMDNSIITEFVRFHPILKNQDLYKTLDREYIRNTIFIDLTRSESEILQNYSPTNRNKIRKAERLGLTVKTKSIGNLESFLELYYSTMDKNSAQEYYYFSRAFFENTINYLGDNIELIEVYFEDKVIGVGLFMQYHDFVHYHFSGSDREFLKFAPNNLMLDYMVKRAAHKGHKYFHLGGGYTNSQDDSLFKFKKGFNKLGELGFYIGKKVHNEELYNKIIQYIPHDASYGYFPIYRNPKLNKYFSYM